MPKGRGYSTRVILGGITVVVAITIAFAYWPRRWEIARVDGSRQCVVSRGQSRSEVIAMCGPAARIGDQPKVASWTTVCSAPCEGRGQHLLFYDCDTKLASVEPFTSGYQGCLWADQAQQ